MSTVSWVVGANGVLGRALRRALRTSDCAPFVARLPIDWNATADLPKSIEALVDDFAIHASKADCWEIYWAAGIGTMGSPEEALQPESIALGALLSAIARSRVLCQRMGAFAFASSAGALHSGGADVVTEDTAPAPQTPYGRAKLLQESLILDAFAARAGHSALLFRISTLYGTGAAIGKVRGLLAHMAYSIVRNRPVQIYVPFDTIRDYIAVDDAAQAMVNAMRSHSGELRVRVRIIASERPVTIAEIVSIFKRVAHRPPRITTSASSLSGAYSRQIRFRSNVPEDVCPPKRPLLIGISQLLTDERQAMVRPGFSTASAR